MPPLKEACSTVISGSIRQSAVPIGRFGNVSLKLISKAHGVVLPDNQSLHWKVKAGSWIDKGLIPKPPKSIVGNDLLEKLSAGIESPACVILTFSKPGKVKPGRSRKSMSRLTFNEKSHPVPCLYISESICKVLKAKFSQPRLTRLNSGEQDGENSVTLNPVSEVTRAVKDPEHSPTSEDAKCKLPVRAKS